MTQYFGDQRISRAHKIAKTLLESDAVDLSKTCRVPKTLVEMALPDSKKRQKKTLLETDAPDLQKVCKKTLIDTQNPISTRGKAALEAEVLSLKSECALPDEIFPFRRARKGNYRAKTMLDRRAIAEMVEKFEKARDERAAAASMDREWPDRSDARIDKELEDKISGEFFSNLRGSEELSDAQSTDGRLLIVALILVTLSLLTFLVLPA